MDVSMPPLERYGAQKYWTNSWGGPPIWKYLRRTLYGKLIFLLDWGFSLLVLPYFTPLWLIPLMLQYPCPSWNLKHFISILFLAMFFPIFTSLCELLPKTSNPLQACLWYPSRLTTVPMPAILHYPSIVFGHNCLPSGFVNERYSLICKQHWLWSVQRRWA